tara:strand:+ start:139 stop:312 length:174 start_codon:yes stop_codon:yes gene_type:complete
LLRKEVRGFKPEISNAKNHKPRLLLAAGVFLFFLSYSEYWDDQDESYQNGVKTAGYK